MQPDGQQVVAVSTSQTQPQIVAVEDGSQGNITYIQAETVQGDSETGEQQIRMVVADGQEEVTTGTLVTSDGHEIQVGDDNTLHMVASLAEQTSQNTDEENQVILNTGNAYQTVTIVPSDTNPGEVSYVLIVSQPEDVKDNGQKAGVSLDMSVYDFNEGEQHVATVEGEETAPPAKPRIMKFSPKKSQAVSQAHMCNYCNYTSPKRYLLSRHMKSHSEERPHKCSVCERGFKTLASLQNHVNTHTGTRPHQCKECDSAFTTSGELVRHVRYKHTHEKPHKCTECDYASVELSKLKRHMRCHTGERPYQCPHCTYASPDTYKLKRHLRIHTGEKPYECDVCHARFTQSNSLKAHKLIHSGNKPIFQCELCPTTCGRKTDLRIHVQKLHTSDKPLKCKRCGKSFPDRYTYKVHVKTHEGEKCFKCDLCPYASISQRHLESHMLIHTDQKPYQCEQCDQAFRQKQLLKRHKNLYHDPDYVPPVPKEKTHECSECGRAFRHKGNLIRHMAIHDPDASAQEKAAALRLGRRRKIANGEEVTDEETDDEYDEESLDEQEGITLEASQMTTAEGQQVVVLEVIQLQGPEGEQQTVAVVAGDGMDAAANLQAAIDAEDANACKILRKSSRTRTIDQQNDLHSGIYSSIISLGFF
uniref:C2H2-type domain-containing protein n=1 Tax=Strigamia maritima TaxID=126957 RepID=T1J529_STRMM